MNKFSTYRKALLLRVRTRFRIFFISFLIVYSCLIVRLSSIYINFMEVKIYYLVIWTCFYSPVDPKAHRSGMIRYIYNPVRYIYNPVRYIYNLLYIAIKVYITIKLVADWETGASRHYLHEISSVPSRLY